VTANHRVRRLEMARDNADYQICQLRPVLFQTNPNSVWTSMVEGVDVETEVTALCLNMIASVKVLLWYGGISIQGSTELYITRNGTPIGIKYRDDIHHPIVRPFVGP
jgi:hypothetical protein